MLIRISRTFERSALGAILALGLACMAMAQQPTTTPSTPPVNRTEMDNFSQFLINHPKVYDELRQNPALINDPKFVAQHNELQAFLKDHPGVAQQVQANPQRFWKDEGAFLQRGGEITRTQAADADRFLDNHPQVAQELRKNPGLIDNPAWLAKHQGLEQFLKDHPEIRKEWKEHPEAFERREARYERNNDLDINRAQAARADQFLDNHPEVAKELRQNPNLIDNPAWVAKHQGLEEFLKDHPEIRQQWKEHPEAFERREARYERNNDLDLNRGQVARTDQFLDNHPQVAQELRKNPGLIDNKDYLEHHPQLQQYLNNHAEIRQQWKEHPEAFERREAQYDKNHPPKSQQAKAQSTKAQKPKK